MSYTFYAPTKVKFGSGILEKLQKKEFPGKKALIVMSSGGSAKRNGGLDKLTFVLETADIAYDIFDKVQENPERSIISLGAEKVRMCGNDFIIGLGGGAVIDCAKAIAAMAVNEGDVWDYIAGGSGMGKSLQIPPLPCVAIPTTSGTGSEVDAGSVITNVETCEKIGFSSACPVLTVVDPKLMRSIPPRYTAFQGFDALFHCTEGFISNYNNEMSDMLQLEVMRNVAKYLPIACQDGKNLKARERLAFASVMSGYSMMVGACTSEHSIEHAMSAFHPNLPHGAGLILISVSYYTYLIKKGVCPERFIQMAQVMGSTSANDPMDFPHALKKLIDRCSVGELKMSDYGITSEELLPIVKNAIYTRKKLFEFERIPLTIDDWVLILEDAYR